MKRVLIGLGFIALAGCAAVASNPAIAPLSSPAPFQLADARESQTNMSKPAECQLRTKGSRSSSTLEAVLFARAAIAGEYALTIETSGPNGSSDISQGGPFAAAAGETQILSASDFSLEGGTRIKATLTIKAMNGRVLCTQTFKS